MLVLGSRLNNTPVMSLQTGTRLARTGDPLIDPATLKIVAFEVDGPLLDEHPSFLRTADIREMGGIGMIIDSSEEFVGLNDVIKLKELRELGFKLIGMPVIDERKHRLGKVDGYTVETGSFVIQQLNVNRGLFKGFTTTGLLVHRNQITEINDDAIIVKSAAKKSPEPVLKATRNEYVNPFRPPATPEPET
ncbi:MAG: hypothetical protein WAV04_01190 [Candidatus Microsaccharimonas sp.]|jgi:uncharacterized protein YrrD